MTTDLERELRVALHDHAAAVTPERLRYAAAPRRDEPRAERPRWVRFAPALAAACVAVLALTLTLVLGGGSSHPSTPAGGRAADPPAGVLGRSWTLIQVQAPNGATTAIAPALGAEITFLAEPGRLELQDGVSVFDANYTVASDGDLFVHDVSGDFVAYCGHDRGQLAAIAGVDPLTYNSTGVSVRLRAGRLQITTNGYVLTLASPVRVAPSAAVSRGVPATPSGVRTTAASAAPGPHC